ncbi:MAG: DUF5020 family protein [Bacteroidales bacterium]|uniref:DUF5020 family protein n=1 Tax=Porphyromonas sp. TaxID=1924944 RepID=UPI002978A2AC|nr:DUF5020 family protein [Porphyromonas sp.]MDD7437386.1 DUF5020 family protein [Bacteroidales bacterium]MDY3066454.1 DUF5020 family protein [Porphyromonas sp.]
MKKLMLIALGACLFGLMGSAKAQTNLQYHYTVGNHLHKDLQERKEPSHLVTLEHSSLDKWGSNFAFVDMNMGYGNLQNVYTQIHRDTRFWKAPIYIHTEYNGGVMRGNQFAFNHSYLGGIAWKYGNDRTYLGVNMSYRYDQGWAKPHNMTLHTVWIWNSWNRIFTINGFATLSTQNLSDVTSGIRFISEPQFWINLNQFVGVHDDFNLSLGTEIKLSYSMVAPDRFYALPTLGVKWTFK